MKIEVWSDVACPWCWLGKRNLEEALRRAGVEAEVEMRSFELAPHARGPRPYHEHLAERYDPRMVAFAEQRLVAAGEEAGIRFDFARAVSAPTFDAHRIHHLAKERGLGAAVMDRLFRAQHEEGMDVSDRPTLARLAAEAGLDADEAERVLASDRYAAEVRADEEAAAVLSIEGVPFFVLAGRVALGGAQPVETFERAIALAQKRAADAAAATPR